MDQGTVCPICNRGPFKYTRGLKEHLQKDHEDHEELEKELQALGRSPKKACPYCGKATVKVMRHMKSCIAAKRAQEKHGERSLLAEKAEKHQAIDEGNFVEKYKERLRSAKGGMCKPNTVKNYVWIIRKIIDFEEKKDSGFNPWDWFAWGTPRIRVIRECCEYFEAKGADGPKTKDQILCVYKNLWDWMEEVRLEKTESPEAQFARRKLNLDVPRKNHKHGKYIQPPSSATARSEEGHAAVEKRKKLVDPATKDLDPALTSRLLQAWADSKDFRKKMCKRIIASKGTPGFVSTRGQGLALTALTTYLENGGIRPEVVYNITMEELGNATETLVACDYCNAPAVVFSDHKKGCVPRKKWLLDPKGGGHSEGEIEHPDFSDGKETSMRRVSG